MSTNQAHNQYENPATAESNGGPQHHDFEKATHGMSHEEKQRAVHASRFGYGPLAHMKTNDSGGLLPAFGGEFQPGLYKGVENRKFANPAPLGLSAFALTTFVLSLINVGAHDLTEPNIVIALAFGYGGLVQLLAGMWEMAVGNTFGATALSSYGGFWLSFAIVLTPGGFQIESTLEEAGGGSLTIFHHSFSLFLWGWFVFTTVLLICTLKSTVAFFLLFFTLDMAFLFLAIAYGNEDATGHPMPSLVKTGGAFGLMAAFIAWYNALAGIADTSNSFFIIPVAHLPWSEKAMERKKAEHTV
ncbi:Meiotically up-regulated protein 86 protein [Exophiala xenobiotica]|uniref:Meiotically up-regulated protein 86 protein n=1 Tax=Lithohypha guttulata TaxID=1690604 RepID=A0ABR0KNT9_9EURO|nr:Meiotically up-regulated protein 86 protein [Lithohypha guttulata]KAK5329170.1 Meiotically up-regulated protein 86 protein [Exophiala xenobiotica]